MAKFTTSRAVIGEFYRTLEQDIGNTWVPGCSMEFTSDQESETYAWLGQSPAMREWVGARQAKGLTENGITIMNKKFESTLEIPVDWIRRDKTGQIQVRIREMAERANSHWASLLSTLIINGESAVCYDGQYFFDTDHTEDDSGVQSNKINTDITTPAAPTLSDMQTAILSSTQQLLGFKDNQGEPMNENAREFIVMVPVPFMSAAAAALGATVIGQTSNQIQALGSLGGFTYRLAVNARLTWATKFALMRADGSSAAFIRQEEEKIKVSALAEGSEVEFTHDVHRYGIKAMRNVGYGYWQRAVLNTFI
ncbi:Mu-like prophage major head subunit gpT family protein [Methylomonas sp. SURF-1]|uniref:Mu-like prophage major head subunit gpT family protein n=1 Tax=Methylomonas aurea TaxID=2952224 RepID=A0ABT1UJ04_9GAMM|nr:Mu-like prophage major head subunit gpT family protein [Methylomonas sp. SURF-1]MCQ8182222.1 Mu-like prophage major head subunit gpT family protein [Methylomonas sp. SURF-1]